MQENCWYIQWEFCVYRKHLKNWERWTISIWNELRIDPVLKTITKQIAHTSILQMNKNIINKVVFFGLSLTNWILDTSKSAQSEGISFKIFKDHSDIFANFIIKNFNHCIRDGKFPNQLRKTIALEMEKFRISCERQILLLSLKKETITINRMINPSYSRFKNVLLYD